MTYLQEINKNLNDGNFKIKVGILKKKVVNSKVNIGKSDLRVKNFNFKEKNHNVALIRFRIFIGCNIILFLNAHQHLSLNSTLSYLKFAISTNKIEVFKLNILIKCIKYGL